MIFKMLLFLLLNIGAIWLDYSRSGDRRKSAIALATLLYLFFLSFAGSVSRAVLPFFILFELSILLAWLFLLRYLLTGKYCWKIYTLPPLLLGLYLLLDFVGGARYE